MLAERAGGVAGGALHRLGVGDIDCGLVRRVGRGECGGIAVPQADARALGRQPRGDAGADAGHAAGDDGHAIRET